MTEIPKFTLDKSSKSYQEGVAAFFGNDYNCPYPIGVGERYGWFMGYFDTKLYKYSDSRSVGVGCENSK